MNFNKNEFLWFFRELAYVQFLNYQHPTNLAIILQPGRKTSICFLILLAAMACHVHKLTIEQRFRSEKVLSISGDVLLLHTRTKKYLNMKQ
jgi:hypothetical protein